MKVLVPVLVAIIAACGGGKDSDKPSAQTVNGVKHSGPVADPGSPRRRKGDASRRLDERRDRADERGGKRYDRSMINDQ